MASTPTVEDIGFEDMFERFQADMERDEKADRASIISPPVSVKPKANNTNQMIRSQAASKNPVVAMEEKAKGSSGSSSKAAANPTEGVVDKPVEKPAEKPTEKPTLVTSEKVSEKSKPASDATAAKPVAKAKTAKELRAERKKGKNKAVPIDTRQTSEPLESAIED